jgi:hypothetical protein
MRCIFNNFFSTVGAILDVLEGKERAFSHLFCCLWYLLRHEELVDMGMQTTESKVLMDGMLPLKQSTVRLILVVLPQDKWWCAFFWFGMVLALDRSVWLRLR